MKHKYEFLPTRWKKKKKCKFTFCFTNTTGQTYNTVQRKRLIRLYLKRLTVHIFFKFIRYANFSNFNE